jgi:hypothetical protein
MFYSKEIGMRIASLLAVAGILGLAGVALADAASKPMRDGIGGKIVKMDGANITIKCHGQDGNEVVVTTDDKTVVTIEGKDAKVADLKVDLHVWVTPKEGMATKIVASTKMPMPDGLHGKIVSFDGLKIMIKCHDENAKAIEVTSDDKTIFTLDDKDAKLADLKVDMYVHVMPKEGTATKVVACTKMPAPDNSGVNVRDRAPDAKTAGAAGQTKSDVQLAADIRKGIMDTKMSMNAQNSKIVVQSGKVTLRGPVKTQEEKDAIGRIAIDVAGAANVDNQLEVESKP